jgi:hypothetical protein
MTKLRLAFALLSVCAAAIATTTPTVSAAPATGCAAGGSGWTEMTVAAIAARIWPGFLDKTAFPGGQAELEQVLGTLDRNGDGALCLKITKGEDLNPNSRWYREGIEILGTPTEFYNVHDNTANASNV